MIGADEETQEASVEAANDSTNATKGKYKCQMNGCGQSFETVQKLNRHKKFKCPLNKSFTCQRCEKSFALRIMMMRHICTGGTETHPNLSSTAQ